MRQLESLLHNAIGIQADSIVSSLDASPIRSKCILSSEICDNCSLHVMFTIRILFCIIARKVMYEDASK